MRRDRADRRSARPGQRADPSRPSVDHFVEDQGRASTDRHRRRSQICRTPGERPVSDALVLIARRAAAAKHADRRREGRHPSAAGRRRHFLDQIASAPRRPCPVRRRQDPGRPRRPDPDRLRRRHRPCRPRQGMAGCWPRAPIGQPASAAQPTHALAPPSPGRGGSVQPGCTTPPSLRQAPPSYHEWSSPSPTPLDDLALPRRRPPLNSHAQPK